MGANEYNNKLEDSALRKGLRRDFGCGNDLRHAPSVTQGLLRPLPGYPARVHCPSVGLAFRDRHLGHDLSRNKHKCYNNYYFKYADSIVSEPNRKML